MPDQHERDRERAWLARPVEYRPGSGCQLHIHARDARGRCPLCDDLGVLPSWVVPHGSNGGTTT